MSNLSAAIRRLRDYVESQQARAAQRSLQEFWQRDMDFLDTLSTWAASSVPSDLNRILEEIRGTSQGFGSYAADLDQLDELLDELVTSTRQTILALRSS